MCRPAQQPQLRGPCPTRGLRRAGQSPCFQATSGRGNRRHAHCRAEVGVGSGQRGHGESVPISPGMGSPRELLSRGGGAAPLQSWPRGCSADPATPSLCNHRESWPLALRALVLSLVLASCWAGLNEFMTTESGSRLSRFAPDTQTVVRTVLLEKNPLNLPFAEGSVIPTNTDADR